jgi:hypothetical protein
MKIYLRKQEIAKCKVFAINFIGGGKSFKDFGNKFLARNSTDRCEAKYLES